eukprot:763054_1
MFLDMMGISVTVPVMPYFAETFGASSFELGALLTSYAVASTVATLIMGKCSDRFGRRPMILFSLFGTMIGFLFSGLAQNYTQLLISRFVCGAFGISRPIAQAFITDVIADKAERNKYLALTGAAIGMSFVIGPGIGVGMATLFGLRSAFFTSSFLGAVGFVIAYFKLIESHPKYTTFTLPSPAISTEDNDKRSQSIPKIIWALSFFFMMEQFGWVAYTSMFLLYLIHTFDFNVFKGGITVFAFAVAYSFNAGYFYHKISKKIGQYNACLLGCLTFSIFLATSVVTDYLWLTLLSAFMYAALGESMVTSSIPGIASNFTNDTNRGYIMGVVSTASSIAWVIGPLMHGAAFGYDPKLPFFIGSGCIMIAFIGFLVM